MKGIGFIAGDTLEKIQAQWSELIGVSVNAILFDRQWLKRGFCYGDVNKSSEEKEAIWRYMETIEAAQQISGNCYETLDDLKQGDTLVLVDLSVLYHAEPDIWEKVMKLCEKGVHIAVLSECFHSRGEFGKNVIRMMNSLYGFGRTKAR